MYPCSTNKKSLCGLHTEVSACFQPRWQLFLTSWACPSLWLGEFSKTYQLVLRNKAFGRKIFTCLKKLYGPRNYGSMFNNHWYHSGAHSGTSVISCAHYWHRVLRAPSAGFLMVSSWVGLLVGLRGEMPPRGTLAGSGSGPMGTSWGSRRPRARPCTCLRAICNISSGWERNGMEGALLRRTWGSWWMTNFT